jgi:hypothetical protein
MNVTAHTIPTIIIEDSANRFFRVRETGNPALAHVYLGIEVKRTRDGFVPKANAREILVRKAATTIVA